MNLSEAISLVGLLVGLCITVPISLIALAVSIWVAWTMRTQSKIFEVQTLISKKDLTLTAYSNAVQGILGLKQTFSDNAGSIFKQQMGLAPEISDYIPDYMKEDIPSFLAFAGGMWRFSYVFSVMNRWEELGMTKNERDGLEAEMMLWLQEIPGFHDVYRKHTIKLQAHNPEFLKFLKEKVYNNNFYSSHPEVELPDS